MKAIVSLISLSTVIATHALAWDHVLLNTDTPAQNWEITSQDLGLNRKDHSLFACAFCMVDVKKGSVSWILIMAR